MAVAVAGDGAYADGQDMAQVAGETNSTPEMVSVCLALPSEEVERLIVSAGHDGSWATKKYCRANACVVDSIP
jgi:hypothetical protein